LLCYKTQYQIYEIILGVPLITASGFPLQSFANYVKRIFVAIPNAGLQQIFIFVQMKKLFFYISIAFIFISCSNNTDSVTEKTTQTPKQNTPANVTITKIEMSLSAFGHGTDNYSYIDVYIDFEKDSSYCHKAFYNPAFANKAFTYTLNHAEIKSALALIKRVGLQQFEKDYEKEAPNLPTSKTIIYTTQGKFTINDYGLVAYAPLPQLYKIVYKF